MQSMVIHIWLAAAVTVLLAFEASAQCRFELAGQLGGAGFVSTPFAIDQDNAAFWTPGGLRYVDISEPGEPRLTEYVEIDWSITSMSRQGNIHYIGGNEGMRIVDMSAPGNPEVIAFLPEARGVLRAYGNLLVGSGTQDGPAIYDISDPVNPVLLSNPIPGEPPRFTVSAVRSGNLVWMRIRPGSGFGFIRAWDITDPKNPVVLSEIEERDAPSWIEPFGDYLYYIVDNGLKVIDYTDPTNPRLIVEADKGPALRAWVVDQTLYLRGDVIYPVDISNPGELIFDKPVEIEGNEGLSILDLSKSNGVVTATLGRGGFAVIDIPTPRELNITGKAFQFASSNFPTYSVSENVIANVSESGRLLTVLDRQDPQNPVVAWQRLFPSTVGTPVFDGDIAYILQGGAFDTLVYDFSDPFNPKEIASITTPFFDIVTLHAESQRLYTMGNARILSIYDTSDPSSPVLIGRSDTPAFDLMRQPQWLRRSGDVVYVSGLRNREYLAVDVSDESNPRWTDFDRFNTFGEPIIRGNRVYTAGSGIGSVFDVTDPFDFVLVGRELPQPPLEIGNVVNVDGFKRYIVAAGIADATAEPGVLIQNMLDPDEPESMLYIPGENISGQGAVQGEYVYLEREAGVGFHLGLNIFRIRDCEVCVADYSRDGRINFFDLAEFLTDYNARTWKSDLTQDSVWNFDDVSVMVDAFTAGCP